MVLILNGISRYFYGIEENFYHNKYNNINKKIKNNKKIVPIPIWMEQPEKRKVSTKEEQDEMNKLLSEYKYRLLKYYK